MPPLSLRHRTDAPGTRADKPGVRLSVFVARRSASQFTTRSVVPHFCGFAAITFSEEDALRLYALATFAATEEYSHDCLRQVRSR